MRSESSHATDAARLARAKAIFLDAIELGIVDRDAFVEQACEGDRALRQLVLELLAGEALPLPVETLAEDIRVAAASVQAQTSAFVGEQAGAMIGRYRLLERIGEGGFGVVFAAEQTQPVKRRVALKLIKLGMDTRQVIARFDAERQALAMMDHPSIAKVFDGGATATGRPYFVMELVRGQPFTQYCDQHKLGINERLRLFMQVCEAVQHAHSKGIIHRDLKPSNVLVTEDGAKPLPKVIDFGIAKATNTELTEKTIYTQMRQMIGTPEYMSPEQASVSSLDIDTRTDIYSLGVILYELLAGVTPFDGPRLRSAAYGEVQRIIRDEEPPKPSTRLSQHVRTLAGSAHAIATSRRMETAKLPALLKGELDWIAMKAMDKDRNRRYQSADAFARDIERYLSGEAVLAAPPSKVYVARKFVRRNFGAVLAGSLIAASLLVGAAGFAWQAQLARKQRDVAQQAQKAEAQQRVQADKARAEALEQEAEARKQAAIAEAVAKFQTDMLAAVDPSQLPRDAVTNELLRDKVTVLQAIEAAIKKLDEGSLKDQPLVEARVRETIGQTLSALGRQADAERVLRTSLEIRRSLLPVGHPDIAQSLNSLAGVVYALNGRTEAEVLYRESLEILRAALPAEHPDIAANINNLAVLLVDENKLADAEPLYREALHIRRAALPVGHPDIANSLSNLATLLASQNKPAEAEPLYREALAIRRAAFPEGHPEIARGLNHLALLLKSQDRLAEAEPLYREALTIRRAAYPTGHPEIAKTLSNLAGLLRDQDKPAEAEPLYREALAIRRAALPAGDEDTATTLNNLGNLLRSQRRYAEAEPLAREALAMFRAAQPPGHQSIATGLNNLALLLKVQGRLAEAEPLYQESLEIRRAALPAGHPDISIALVNLAELLADEGKPAEAEPLYREALQIERAASPAGQLVNTTTINGLAQLLVDNEAFAEAEPLFREALSIRRAAPDARRADIAASLSNLGNVQMRLGKLAEARAVFDEAVALLREDSPEGSASLARALWRSGSARIDDELPTALPQLEEAVAMGEKFLKPESSRLATYRQTLERAKEAAARNKSAREEK